MNRRSLLKLAALAPMAPKALAAPAPAVYDVVSACVSFRPWVPTLTRVPMLTVVAIDHVSGSVTFDVRDDGCWPGDYEFRSAGDDA